MLEKLSIKIVFIISLLFACYINISFADDQLGDLVLSPSDVQSGTDDVDESSQNLISEVADYIIDETRDNEKEEMLEIKVSAEANVLVNPAGIAAAQSFEFVVIASWEGSVGVLDFQVPELMPCENLNLLKSKVTNDTSIDNGKVISRKIFSYTFAGEKEGNARIGEVKVGYKLVGEDTLHTLRTSEQKVKILPPKKEFHIGGKEILILSVILLVIVIVVVGIVIVKKKKEKAKKLSEEKPRKTLQEIYIEQLGKANEMRIAGDVKAYYQQIRSSLINLIIETFSLTLKDITRENLELKITEKYGSEKANIAAKLSDVIEECDIARFSPVNPSAIQLDKIYEEARNLINDICAAISILNETTIEEDK